MEDRLKLQHPAASRPPGPPGLRHSAHPESTPAPDPSLNRRHRPREIAPRSIRFHSLLEGSPRSAAKSSMLTRPARRSTVRPDLLPRLDTRRFRISNDFNFFCLGPSVGSSPEGWPPNDRELPGPFAPTPLQGPHRYYGPVRPCAPHRYSRTRSVRCLWFSLLRPKTLAVLSGRQVLRSVPAPDELTPPIHRAPPGPHTGSSPTEGPPRRPSSRDHPQIPGFDAIVISFHASAVVHACSSSHRTPAPLQRDVNRALTTPALERSLRWWSLRLSRRPRRTTSITGTARIRRRSLSSSSLPFRTHVGCRNSAWSLTRYAGRC